MGGGWVGSWPRALALALHSPWRGGFCFPSLVFFYSARSPRRHISSGKRGDEGEIDRSICNWKQQSRGEEAKMVVKESWKNPRGLIGQPLGACGNELGLRLC